jgi:hypothetical protein
VKVNLVGALLVLVRKFRLIHLHWSTLDLAAGAMICQLAINRLPTGKSSVPLPVTFVLGFSVFVISAINRLLDNRKPVKMEMKRFLPNQKNRITFLEVIAGGLVIAIFLCFYLPENLWKIVAGLVLIAGFLTWLVSRLPERNSLHALRVPVSAIIFTVAILTGTSFLTDAISKEIKYSGLLFFLVVFQNFLLSAYFQFIEFPGVFNLASFLKVQRSKQLLYGLTFLIIAGGISICLKTDCRYTQRFTVILTLLSVLQSFMLLNTELLKRNKYKGMLLALVFIIPLLIL